MLEVLLVLLSSGERAGLEGGVAAGAGSGASA